MVFKNAISWFEIPTTDLDRAQKFYETIFDYQMPENQMGPARMGFLLYDFQGGKVGGAIVHYPDFYSPSDNGSLIYLNCQPDLQVVLDRVTGAGGKVLQQKTAIPGDLGYWASMLDSEGNRVALHSMG